MFTPIRRVIKSGFQAFRRDGEIAVATIFVLFLAVMLVSSLFLFKDISQFLISKIQERIDISIYFREDITEEDILSVKEKIYKFPEVKEIDYVSQDEALENFTARHKKDSVLIESIKEVGRNPFLASLNIKAWDPTQYQKLSDFLNKPEFENLIEKVDYYERKTVIDRICSLSSFVTKIGVSLSVILIIVAIAVTYNTIRLSIYNSRKEIKVQRLVGASNWFIRGPFLVQGIICGFLAVLISLLLFSAICWFLSPKIEKFFFELNIFNLFIENFWLMFSIQLATGIGLGMFSSAVAVRKYLKD